MALAQGNMGDIVFEQGDLARAKNLYLQSKATWLDKPHLAGSLIAVGDVLCQQGNLAGARKEYEQALDLLREAGDNVGSVWSLLHVAALSIEEGKPADSEAPTRKVIEQSQRVKYPVNEAWGYEVLARSFLARGRVAEAQTAIGRAEAASERSHKEDLKLSVEITSARIRAANGAPQDAARALETTLSEATKLGFARHQLEAGLALGEVEVKSGHTEEGRARLAALEKDARSKGFTLVARKAAALLSASEK